MRLKSWQSLLLRARSITLEVEDRKERIDERREEFERLVAKALGINVPQPKTPEVGETGLTLWEDGPEAQGAHENVPEAEKTPESPPEEPSGALSTEVGAEESKGPECPPAIRRIYGMIVSRTHPDKTGGDLGLVLLYRKAVRAKERGAFEEILDIAFELCLDLPYDGDLVPYIERRVKALSEEYQRLGSLFVWHWLNAPDQAARDGVIRAVAQRVRLTPIPRR